MSDREVTRSRKDKDGDITALCNPGNWWSPRLKKDVISDINLKIHTYFVRLENQRVNIRVVQGQSGPYLRTDPDITSRNNLDDLLDC